MRSGRFEGEVAGGDVGGIASSTTDDELLRILGGLFRLRRGLEAFPEETS